MAHNRLNKLELTWIGKYDEDKQLLEPRILIENPEYSHGEVETGVLPNGKQWNGNMLIHGDNLLALKSLEQDYAGCVKCIYIDPPYNTGSAFEHYDDGVEHSIWLSLMRERLVILHHLLSNDGSIWISLDDTEQAYCKVLCDEIFGRGFLVRKGTKLMFVPFWCGHSLLSFSRVCQDLTVGYVECFALFCCRITDRTKLRYAILLINNAVMYIRDAPVDVKMKLIGSMFPEKLSFDGKSYRTKFYCQEKKSMLFYNRMSVGTSARQI